MLVLRGVCWAPSVTKLKVIKNMYNSQLQGKEVHVLKTSSVIRERPHPAAWLNPDSCQWSRKCSCAYTQTLLCSWPVTLTLGWSHEAALLCCSSPAAVHPRCAVWNISVSGPCTSAALVNSEVRNAIKENLCLCYCSVCVCVCVCRIYRVLSVHKLWDIKSPSKEIYLPAIQQPNRWMCPFLFIILVV